MKQFRQSGWNRVLSALLAAGTIGALAAASSAAPAYRLTDLGPLGSSTSEAVGLAGNGLVVGEATVGKTVLQEAHAYVWRGGRPHDLGTLGGRTSRAHGVNGRGEVVGEAQVEDGDTHAFLRGEDQNEDQNRDGDGLTDLGTLGGQTSIAYGVNGRGDVVGTASVSKDGPERHAFLWRGGVMRDLGTLRPDPGRPGHFLGDSTALAISRSGAAVGFSSVASVGNQGHYRACLWGRGRVTDLGSLNGDSVARAVNDRNEVVGQCSVGTSQKHAFLWRRGRMQDIAPFGSAFSDALGVNDFGQVVGTAELSGGEYHAFVYRDGAAQDLNAGIDPASGWLLTEARAINDRGQIAGVGQISGQRHAFLLMPTAVRPRLSKEAH